MSNALFDRMEQALSEHRTLFYRMQTIIVGWFGFIDAENIFTQANNLENIDAYSTMVAVKDRFVGLIALGAGSISICIRMSYLGVLSTIQPIRLTCGA